MRCASWFLAALAAAIAAGYASSASAETYIIDSNLSVIAVSGDIAGAIPLVPQTLVPPSNVITFAGTVDAEDDGTTITFNGSNADAQLQPNPQSPGPGGAPGTAPADAGLGIGAGSALGTVALRDFVIDVSGGPTALVAGTTFDLTDLTLTISAGTLDYNVPAFSLVGSEDLSGTTATPTAGVGTLVGGTLTIPVDVALSFEVSTGIFANVFLAGQVVAVIPEPSAIALLGVGLVGLFTVGYRRVRRR